MIKEFRDFIMRGNVLDLAVGIIIGAAFTAIVGSLVADLINPIIGLIIGGIDLTGIVITLKAAEGDIPAVTLNVGNFLQAIINFLIIAFVVFMLVRLANRMMTLGKKKEAAEEAAAEAAAPPDPILVSQQELKASIDRLTEAMRAK
ncbi:MAG: large-conductance mechanosensitive channel protein MscL [Pleurocapsa minor GSE-CHR-MK-17-07R]|jgi:large conductance mechanosensitive channel|nr:large-conductance mechanosensitive channel protein MscL [Pleurocapsa minor GSE-CHR-MK 17-07R]